MDGGVHRSYKGNVSFSGTTIQRRGFKRIAAMTTETGFQSMLSRKGAAQFLTKLGIPISQKTLNNLAANNNAGRGPSYYKTNFTDARSLCGRRVFYREDDLIAWASTRIRRID